MLVEVQASNPGFVVWTEADHVLERLIHTH